MKNDITGACDLDLDALFASRAIEGYKKQSWFSALLDWLMGG